MQGERSPTAEEAAEEAEVGQCRYCLESSTGLVAPCACSGSSRLVHRECLMKWQRKQNRKASSTCEVCREEWTVVLDVLDREIFTRSVRTNPRFLPIDESVLDETAQERLSALMRPGMLILQSPQRASEMQSLSIKQEAAIAQAQANGQAATQNTLSLFASMLTLQRAKHWHKGAYMIVSRGHGDAADGSDTLVAINLTRLASPEEAGDPELAREVAQLQEGLRNEVPPLLLVGGPCHQTQPLCLVELRDGARIASRGEFLPIPVVHPVVHPVIGDRDSREAPWPAGVALASPAPRATVPDSPSEQGEAELVQDSRGAPSPPLPLLSPPSFVAAEPPVASAIVRLNGGSGVRVSVVQGCAIWSTAQLLSEISRFKWALCPAHASDLPFAPTPRADASSAPQLPHLPDLAGWRADASSAPQSAVSGAAVAPGVPLATPLENPTFEHQDRGQDHRSAGTHAAVGEAPPNASLWAACFRSRMPMMAPGRAELVSEHMQQLEVLEVEHGHERERAPQDLEEDGVVDQPS